MPSKKLKILVVQHVSYESSGIMAPYFKKSGHIVNHFKLYDKKSRFTKDLFKNDVFLFMGGPMSVNDVKEFPWLVDENLFIQDLLAKEKGVLGVCLGAQLLAKALGARVYPGPKKEIGWYTVDLTKEGLEDNCLQSLEREPRNRVRVFHWHGETFDLPKKTVCLAGSKICRNQAFKLNPRTYAVQFHLEMDRPLINRWLVHGRDEIVKSGFKSGVIREESEKYLKGYQKNARQFFDAFIHEISKS
ncbi:MAG: amidotransferase [Candidatus Omnitrophica bacterium]|nr:amidotransferase [Candidatus Omnitrophota bacterium]